MLNRLQILASVGLRPTGNVKQGWSEILTNSDRNIAEWALGGNGGTFDKPAPRWGRWT